jgi:hypothetical protein
MSGWLQLRRHDHVRSTSAYRANAAFLNALWMAFLSPALPDRHPIVPRQLGQGQPQRRKASPRRWRVFFGIVTRVVLHLEVMPRNPVAGQWLAVGKGEGKHLGVSLVIASID